MKNKFFALTATAMTICTMLVAVPTERLNAATIDSAGTAVPNSCTAQRVTVLNSCEDLSKIEDLLETCKIQVYYLQNLCPDGSGGNTSSPDISMPDVSAPDTSVPDISSPDTSAPDVSTPDTSAPDVSAPDTSVPDASAPEDASKPETAPPAETLPDSSSPDTQPPAAEPGDGAESEESVHPYILRVLELVNEERTKAGLNTVTLDSSATAAAMVRAQEIVTNFSHTRPNGSSFTTALKEQGVSYRQAGENIAWGQRTPEQVMEGWMNSSGHRANILNPSFTRIGVGYYQARGSNYWTQLFY